jgi:hypothetical protein
LPAMAPYLPCGYNPAVIPEPPNSNIPSPARSHSE